MRGAVLEIMPSNHCDQLALYIAVAVDVALSCLDRPVTSEQLHIAQRATGLVILVRPPIKSKTYAIGRSIEDCSCPQYVRKRVVAWRYRKDVRSPMRGQGGQIKSKVYATSA